RRLRQGDCGLLHRVCRPERTRPRGPEESGELGTGRSLHGRGVEVGSSRGAGRMSSTSIALASAGCIFSGALVGLLLQRLFPSHHLSKETQDVVKLSAGTIATLTALVLGLLVSSAKSSFDTMNNGIVQSSAKIIVLDRALARYGPETKPAREQLK